MNEENFKIAKEKGYYVDKHGNAYSKHKQLKPKIRHGYSLILVRCNKEAKYLAVHRLQAYQKYGEALFEPGIEVRHLNSNRSDNSWDNIAIGTKSDNMMDRPKALRQKLAKYANKRYSDEMIAKWRELNESGVGFRALAKMFKVAKSTIGYYLGKPDRKQKVIIFDE